MASQPLGFAEILGGGVLLVAALTGASVKDVVTGNAGPFKGFDTGGAASPTTDRAAPGSAPRGTAKFEGHTVAAWMKPALEYARAHGWTGNVTSGLRSYEEQARLYFNYRHGVGNVAAPPGQSNHEGSDYPRGAVDVSNPSQFAAALRGYTGLTPVNHLPNDPVHFSGTGR